MNIYERLIKTIKTLFEESLGQSEASFDDLVSMIELVIEKELGDKHSLQDYILVHDPWKTRDRITATTRRRSIIFYHQSLHEKVSKFKRIDIKQFVDEFIDDSLEEETLEESYSRNFISKMIEFHPLGHIETHNVYTSNYQVKNDLNIQHKYFNLIKKYKRDLDAYKNQIDDHIFNNIMEYNVLAVDENYRSDSYVFVPLNKTLSKNEIEESVKFIFDEVTKVFIGIKYNQKFYPRFDLWMSINDRDLPNFETYSTKEFINEKYLLEDDLYDFRDYLKNASHDVRESLDLKKETNEYNDSLLNNSSIKNKLSMMPEKDYSEAKSTLKKLNYDFKQGNISSKEFIDLKKQIKVSDVVKIMKVCPNCQTKNIDENQLCEYCGHLFDHKKLPEFLENGHVTKEAFENIKINMLNDIQSKSEITQYEIFKLYKGVFYEKKFREYFIRFSEDKYISFDKGYLNSNLELHLENRLKVDKILKFNGLIIDSVDFLELNDSQASFFLNKLNLETENQCLGLYEYLDELKSITDEKTLLDYQIDKLDYKNSKHKFYLTDIELYEWAIKGTKLEIISKEFIFKDKLELALNILLTEILDSIDGKSFFDIERFKSVSVSTSKNYELAHIYSYNMSSIGHLIIEMPTLNNFNLLEYLDNNLHTIEIQDDVFLEENKWEVEDHLYQQETCITKNDENVISELEYCSYSRFF